MDFDLSDEQRQLGDNLARLMKDRYGFESRKAYGAAPLGFSEDLWRQYAELGLLGAPFAEADGGFGGGAVETMLIEEAFGRALVLEPYLPTVVLGGGVLRHGASQAQREAMISAIAAGELRLALAHAERALRLRTCSTSRRARARTARLGCSTARRASCSTATARRS